MKITNRSLCIMILSLIGCNIISLFLTLIVKEPVTVYCGKSCRVVRQRREGLWKQHAQATQKMYEIQHKQIKYLKTKIISVKGRCIQAMAPIANHSITNVVSMVAKYITFEMMTSCVSLIYLNIGGHIIVANVSWKLVLQPIASCVMLKYCGSGIINSLNKKN